METDLRIASLDRMIATVERTESAAHIEWRQVLDILRQSRATVVCALNYDHANSAA